LFQKVVAIPRKRGKTKEKKRITGATAHATGWAKRPEKMRQTGWSH
jgi:hypothetical protein